MKEFIAGGIGLLGSVSAAELFRLGHTVRKVFEIAFVLCNNMLNNN